LSENIESFLSGLFGERGEDGLKRVSDSVPEATEA